MERIRYSEEWKMKQVKWAQYHKETRCWKLHYIRNDTEYSTGNYIKKQYVENEIDSSMYRGYITDRLSGDILGKTHRYRTWEDAQCAAERLCKKIGYGERSEISIK